MNTKPASCLISEDDLSLFADYYEFTMGKANWDGGRKSLITENYFVRGIPQGNFLVTAGLEQVVHFLMNFRFTDKHIAWLRKTSGKDLSRSFLKHLKSFRFKGDLYAMPEGTIAFPQEPIINITGDSDLVQFVETYLLNIMNFQTLIATKATRMVQVAHGKVCLEFGARRAHGRDAAILGARAAYIGGFAATSLVAAAYRLGIPYAGTMAHKFVQEFDDELTAFREYSRSFPHNTILLIDTYGALRGIKNACIIGKEMEKNGYKLKGVRLDSGNLSVLSREVREILNQAGLNYVKIFVSNDIDEFMIDDLLKRGAPIDGFGIGTRLITGANYFPLTGRGGPSALPGVYKLAEKIEGEVSVPKMKLSDDPLKATLPGKKQVYRFCNFQGEYLKDQICLSDEKWVGAQQATPLLIPIISCGKIVYDFPPLEKIREKVSEELKNLPYGFKDIHKEKKYPVRLSKKLQYLYENNIF